jgi:hypothetical protein
MKASERETLLATLKERFEMHTSRHEGIRWDEVQKNLEGNDAKLKSLKAMEDTGGEPDVVGRKGDGGAFLFVDCSAESPAGRRSVCFDREGWESRKAHRPEHNALDMAAEMGIGLLTEAQYRELQELGEFDTRTSSWVSTPDDVRKLGGALFCDRRYGRVFVYHNGAQSYYAARGFRGILEV